MFKKVLRIWSVIVWKFRKKVKKDKMMKDWWMEIGRPYITKYD